MIFEKYSLYKIRSLPVKLIIFWLLSYRSNAHGREEEEEKLMKEERDGGEDGNERQKELSKSFVGSTRYVQLTMLLSMYVH